MPQPEEVNPFAVRVLDPKTIRLFRVHPQDATVRATLENDRSWREVRIARAFPFSDPNRYIGLRDGEDKDIGILTTLDDLDNASRQIVEEELERRYFTPKITRIVSLEEQFGVVTWDVETDKGTRHFIIRNLRDNSYTIGSTRLMVTDIDGNRYEVPDVNAVGTKAYAILAKVL